MTPQQIENWRKILPEITGANRAYTDEEIEWIREFLQDKVNVLDKELQEKAKHEN